MTGDHFDQYAALNPVPDVDALSEGVSPETTLLEAIDRKSAEHAAQRSTVTSPARRRWKGPLIAVAAMAAALIAGITVLTTVSRPDTAGEPEPTPTTQPQPAPESNGMGDPAMWVWTEIEAPGGQILSDGRRFYAVDRGDTTGESVTIWSSTDGVTWQRHLDDIAGEPFHEVKAMVAAAGRVLISFQSIRQPDPPLTAADRPIVVAVVEADGSVASGEIPPEVPEAVAGYASIDIAASAVGPRGALIWTVPTLNRETVLREASKLWVSADGREWRSMPAPDFLDVSTEADIIGIDDGFLIRHGTRVSYSPDGSEWSELSAPPELYRGGGPGMHPWLGAGLVWNDAGFWRVTSAGFERLPLSDAPTPPRRDWAGFGVGDAGIVYVSEESNIVYSPDGQTWFTDSLPEVDGLTEAFNNVFNSPIIGADVVVHPGAATLDGSHVFRASSPGG